MKIDKFFVKQNKAQAGPNALKRDASVSKQKAAAQQAPRKDVITVKADKEGAVTETRGSANPEQDSMDIDQQVQKHQQKAEGAGVSGVPLLDFTNQQQLPPAAAGKMLTDTIDLSIDSPKPVPQHVPAAAADKADQDQQQEQEEGLQQDLVLEEAEDAPPDEMEVDEAPAETAVAAMAADEGNSPAADTGRAEAAVPAAAEETAAIQGQPAAGAEPATPAAARVPAAAATPGTTVNSSTAKAPAEAFLTPEQRKQLLEACKQEVPLLEAELDVRPDLAAELQAYQQQQQAAGSSKKAVSLDLKYQVSVLVEGQSMTLTQLAQHISCTLGGSSSGSGADKEGAAGNEDAAAAEGAVTALAIRNIIQDVASRKSYGLQDGLLANVDALEDATASYHWCWELRTFTGLPKPVKQAADAARKRRKQVLDRLKAAAAYTQLARSFTKSTKAAEAKLAKAAAKLAKLPGLGDTQHAAATAVAAAVQAAAQQHASAAKAKADADAQADKAAKEAAQAENAAKAEAKEAETAAKELEKAAKAAAKAAEAEEKAHQKAEAEQKREEARKQKAEEAARKASEAAKKKQEAAKKKEAAAAAKKGFHSISEMHKAQGALTSFLGKAVRRTPTPAGPSGDTSQGTSSQHEGNQAGATHLQRVWAAPPVAPSQQQVSLMQQLEQELPYLNCSTEDACGGGGGCSAASSSVAGAVQPVAELLSSLVQHWKGVRVSRKRVWGLPPSWAQRPGAADDPSHIMNTAVALCSGQGKELAELRCFRRKLIKHHDSARPAFYGSMSQRSRAICGRKPFGQDVELDYEVMSDQDWEEEPDGENLSDEADDDEEAAGTEAEEDEEGFVVGDGYLSEDEGMRDVEEDAAADNQAGCASGDGGTPEQAALAQLEAGLERAWQRGRPLVLANNCPEMNWEPTSNLDPSLLSSLKGTVLCPGVVLAPPTPAQLWHLYPESRITATAVGGGSSAAGEAGAAAAAAAGEAGAGEAGAAAAAGAGASGAGQRGRPPSAFPDALLPALVAHIQANSNVAIDKLVVVFVEAQAAAGVKVAKARVKDKIKDITTMKMIAKAPKYTVKPEFLQLAAAAADGTPAVAAAAQGYRVARSPTPEAAADVRHSTPDVPQKDDSPAPSAAAQQQQQQQEQQQRRQGVGAVPVRESGLKRMAPDAAVPAAAEGNSSLAGGAGATPVAAAGPESAAADITGPPMKKQRTPGAGIERFFSRASQQQTQQQLGEERQQQQQPQPQQLEVEQQLETPPSTPRQKQSASVEAAAAATAADPADEVAGGVGSSADVGGVYTSGGVLPMLTPPSHDIGVDRPTVSNSPVPFRMNSAAGAAAGGGGGGGGGADAAVAAPAAERPPINRWHAQANCRGLGLQGGNAGCVQEQHQQHPDEQQASQPFAGFEQPQQQHEQDQQQQDPAMDAFLPATAAAGAAAMARAAAAAAAAGTSRAGAGNNAAVARGSSASSAHAVREVPQLFEDGSPPSLAFWKQLASWIVGVRDPCAADIEQAFAVFDKRLLESCMHTMPQMVLTAMVKTLGSPSQGLPMREACAKCIGNTALAFTMQQLKAPIDAAADTQMAAEAAAPASSSPEQQQQQRAAASPVALGSAHKRGAASGSPSPGPSPRSAPVEASFEELCAEPGLLSNFIACSSTEKVHNMAKEAAAKSSGSRTPTELEAKQLSNEALSAMAALLKFGLYTGLDPEYDWQPSAAEAASRLRAQVAAVNNWRGALRAAANSEDRRRSTAGLVCLWALLSDPASAKKVVNSPRMAKLLLKTAAECGMSRHWVVQKWGLMMGSAFLAEEAFREQTLPKEALCRGPTSGAAEDMDCLERLAYLAAAVLTRQAADLSSPGPDRMLASKALSLAHLLVQLLDSQQALHNGHMPKRLAAILHGDEDNSGLRAALEEVSMQDAWEEAAERARNIIALIDSSSSNGEAPVAAAATDDADMEGE